MDAKGIRVYEGLVESIAKKKQEMGETVAAFPKSSQEYLELPLEERMKVATDILRTYAPNATDGSYGPGKPAPAEITPSDVPGVKFKGEVVHKKWMAGGPTHKQQRHHGIEVSVTAVDVATGVTADARQIRNLYHDGVGGIKRGPYTDEAGETQTGWYAWSNYDGKEHPLTGQFGQGLVEFVDVAVAGLLDGEMLTQHRQFVGSQALEGAVEPVA